MVVVNKNNSVILDWFSNETARFSDMEKRGFKFYVLIVFDDGARGAICFYSRHKSNAKYRIRHYKKLENTYGNNYNVTVYVVKLGK